MLSHWSQELQKIKAFRAFSLSCEIEGLPISILGFTHTDEGVDLHFLSYSPVNREPVYMDFDKAQSHREEMISQYKPEDQPYLWGRTVYFGNREVPVKSSHGGALGTGQLDSDWILSEALRQGWDWKPFEDYGLMDLSLTTMSLEIDFLELEELLKEPKIRIVRDETHKTYLVEANFELPIGGKFAEPVTLDLADYLPNLEGVIVLHGLELRDMWKDFEAIYEEHRRRGTFTEEKLDAFIQENEESFQHYCPRGMCFPVVNYESAPEISIQCYATDYLETVISRQFSNSSSSMCIMLKTDGELGLRGLPLKNDVIQYAMHPDAKSLKFEVFYVHQRLPLTDIVFER